MRDSDVAVGPVISAASVAVVVAVAAFSVAVEIAAASVDGLIDSGVAVIVMVSVSVGNGNVVDVAAVVVVVVTQSAPFIASLLNDQLYYSMTGLDSKRRHFYSGQILV